MAATEITKFRFRQYLPSTLAGVFKFIHFEERIQKVSFSVTKNVVLVWTEGQSGEKKKKKCVSG